MVEGGLDLFRDAAWDFLGVEEVFALFGGVVECFHCFFAAVEGLSRHCVLDASLEASEAGGGLVVGDSAGVVGLPDLVAGR